MIKSNKLGILGFVAVIALVILGTYSNIQEQKKQDNSKLPEKIEEHRSFQRWITNLKNKGIEIEADEFRLLEEVEIYNTKWMTVQSVDGTGVKEAHDARLAEHREIDKVVFSPSDREYVDFRNIDRDGYVAGTVIFYGQKEDKIITTRTIGCASKWCYFDRGYFLDNDVFVVTEISPEPTLEQTCDYNSTCNFIIKLHLVDLINNKRSTYYVDKKEFILSSIYKEP